SSGVAYPRGGGEDKFKLEATYYGPAFQVTEMEGVMRSRLVNAHTPIDQHNLHLRFGVMLKRLGDPIKTQRLADAYVDNLQVGFAEHIASCENMCYRSHPILSDADGPIAQLPKGYSQFSDQRAHVSLPQAPAD